MSSGRFDVHKDDEDKYHVLLFLSTAHGGPVSARTLDERLIGPFLQDFNIDTTPLEDGNKWKFEFADIEFDVLKRWRLIS